MTATVSGALATEPAYAERRLVADYLTGDDEAFADIYRSHYPKVVAWVVRRTGNRSLAEDVAQDTLMSAMRYMGGFDLERPLWPWIHRIAEHALARRLMAAERETPVDELPEQPSLDVECAVEQLSDRSCVRAALSVVSARQRAALWLRYAEERSSAEGAAAFGISPNAFDQLLWRAKTALRAELEKTNIRAAILGLPLVLIRRVVQLFRPKTASTAAKVTAPLAAIPVIGMLVIGTAAIPLLTSPAEGSAPGAPVLRTARLAAVELPAPGLRARTFARGVASASESVDGSTTHAAPKTVSATAGPAQTDVEVAPNPFADGKTIHHGFYVPTPVGTVFVEGDTTNSGARVVCGVVSCQ